MGNNCLDLRQDFFCQMSQSSVYKNQEILIAEWGSEWVSVCVCVCVCVSVSGVSEWVSVCVWVSEWVSVCEWVSECVCEWGRMEGLATWNCKALRVGSRETSTCSLYQLGVISLSKVSGRVRQAVWTGEFNRNVVGVSSLLASEVRDGSEEGWWKPLPSKHRVSTVLRFGSSSKICLSSRYRHN